MGLNVVFIIKNKKNRYSKKEMVSESLINFVAASITILFVQSEKWISLGTLMKQWQFYVMLGLFLISIVSLAVIKKEAK